MTIALKIVAGPYTFDARLERVLAPRTCEAFAARLPFEAEIVHVRWSGEGVSRTRMPRVTPRRGR